MAKRMTDKEFITLVTPYIRAAIKVQDTGLDLRAVKSGVLRADCERAWAKIPKAVRAQVTARGPLKIVDDPNWVHPDDLALIDGFADHNLVYLARRLEGEEPLYRERTFAHEVAHVALGHSQSTAHPRDAAKAERWEDDANRLARAWIPYVPPEIPFHQTWEGSQFDERARKAMGLGG